MYTEEVEKWDGLYRIIDSSIQTQQNAAKLHDNLVATVKDLAKTIASLSARIDALEEKPQIPKKGQTMFACISFAGGQMEYKLIKIDNAIKIETWYMSTEENNFGVYQHDAPRDQMFNGKQEAFAWLAEHI